MPKGTELTDFEREEIVGLHKGGFSYEKIEKILDRPKTTIRNVIKKFNEQGLTSTAPRSGRPKILSERDERHLIKIVKNNRNESLEEIIEKFNTAMNISVSSRTIQRTLYNKGYSGHAAKKSLLFQKKIEKKDMDGVVWEKIGIINGVMNHDLNFLIIIQEIGFGIKKMNNIKLIV